MSGNDSILTYAKSRYLWTSLALMGGSLAAYIWHDPGGPPNGGTWLGYTLGTIAAALIVWLMLFGIRKRNYVTSPGTLRGWLSAHVYLGTSLIFSSCSHGLRYPLEPAHVHVRADADRDLLRLFRHVRLCAIPRS
jgi:hypothetical protein